MNSRLYIFGALCLAAGLASGADKKKAPPKPPTAPARFVESGKKPMPPQPAAPDALAKDVFFAYGTVTKVAPGKLTVSEYDYENDEELNVMYELDSAATFKNVESLKNISAGTMVEMTFTVKNNQRRAVQVTVENEDGQDAPDSSVEMYEEDRLLEEE